MISEEEGCRSDIKDTAEFQKEWINSLMKNKKCTCDEEHMFSCPNKADTINANMGHAARDKLDNVLQILMGDDSAQVSYRLHLIYYLSKQYSINE